MSLYGSIRMASNTLRADQIVMQVIGQNLANANTPGYIREEVVLAPAPIQRMGRLTLGLGVQVDAVVQKLDKFLEERLRTAVSDRASAERQEEAYIELERLIGELSETDLSTSLNSFFSRIADVLNQPESVTARNLAVLHGQALTDDIRRLAARVNQLRTNLNEQIEDAGERINRLIEEIRQLNVRIAETEGGDVSGSDAVGLRDQRLQALEQLAELVDIRVEEQLSGGVAVYAGSDFLIIEGMGREVEVVMASEGGYPRAEVRIVATDSPLDISAGQLHGMIEARDEVLTGFLEGLDDLARTLAFEFNKLYSSGQGLVGHTELTSAFAVDDLTLPLDAAGLPFTPTNGSFQLLVRNTKTGLVQTTDILVDLNGLNDELTLQGLADALDAADGLSAAISSDGYLTLQTDSPDLEFAFADDTGGLLAALGLSVFFSGSSASDLGIDAVVRDDPARFAASRGGIGADTSNAVLLANFLDRPLDSQDGATLAELYDRLIGGHVQASTIARSVAEGTRVFEQTLRGQKLSTSGVSLDEEALKLIAHQRSYQASARYIQVLQGLIDVLLNL
ncbi:MAG TPA: flagellar hook-associated protein FlgK [Planctomycetaceae bacterium]|nr:flagellar hook-associated protein FlgK [Planctomycetaceae bacterium]